MTTLFSKDLLFVHVPKAGGSSVTDYLVRTLPPPVYYVHPKRQAGLDDRGLVHVPGPMHLTLPEVRTVVGAYGFEMDAFPLILSVMRNPYDAAVSHYFFFRDRDLIDAERNPVQQLARDLTFEQYAVDVLLYSKQYFLGRLYDFYHLDGEVPPNARVAKFEHLVGEVKAALATVGIEGRAAFPWRNKSAHHPFASYYDEEAERAIYFRTKWVFDQGYYERLQVTNGDTGREDGVPSLG